MSRASSNGVLVIEWSPGKVRAYDAHTNKWKSGSNIGEVCSPGIEAVIAPSRRVTYLKAVRVPNVGASEVRQVLTMQLDQMLPISSNDAATGFRLTSDVNSEGRLAVVCAVKSELLDTIQAEAKAAGVTVRSIVPVAFGSQLLATDQGLQNCTVLEFTPDGLAIDLIADGELRCSRVAEAADSEASIEAELVRTASVAGTQPGTIVAAGGLPAGVATYRFDSSAAELLTSANAGALGVELEAPSVAILKKQRDAAKRVRLAMLTATAAVLVWTLVYFQYADANDRIVSAAGAGETQLRSLRSASSAVELRLDSAKKMQAVLDRAFSPPQSASDVAKFVAEAAPEGLWLTAISFDRGKQLQIRGTALKDTHVTRFLETLTNSDRFRDVKLQFMNDATVEMTKTVQFAASAHVVGNLPIDLRGVAKN